jgi:hypothetical protein
VASTKPNRWLRVSVILIVVGCIFLVINQVVYVSRFIAFGKAFEAVAKNHGVGSPPTPEAYGLDVTSLYISSILGTAGFIFVFIGATYVILLFIGKIIRRLGTPV